MDGGVRAYCEVCQKEVEVYLRNKEVYECVYTINGDRIVSGEVENNLIDIAESDYICSECRNELSIE